MSTNQSTQDKEKEHSPITELPPETTSPASLASNSYDKSELLTEHGTHPDHGTLANFATEVGSVPQDGGFIAWSQVVAGHLVTFNSWGYVNSFGIFQAYYETALHQPPSAISWIGSIQLFLTLFIGTFSGRALDAGYYRHVVILGLGLQILGVFMTSIIKKYWQLLLAQGICQGLGNGLTFTPSLALVSIYFVKRRAVAISCMTCGTATGGIVFPLVARQLLNKVGFAWTTRTMGFIMLVNSAIIIALTRVRQSSGNKGPLIEFAAFADLWYSLFGLGLLLASLGLYFGYYYITSFANDIIHVTTSTSLDMLLVMNAMGIPGRVVPALIADLWLGPLNTLVIIVAISGILTFVWAAVDSLAGTWVFVVMYGFFGAGIQSMFPPALANAQKDSSKIGVRMGMICSVMSIGSLCGEPLAGALIQKDRGTYLYAQMFGGSVMICGSLVLVGSRTLSTGGNVTKRI